MKVSEAKFTRRYNVGQYEHEEYSLVAVVEDDDTASRVLATLKADVAAAYAGDTPTEEETSAKKPQGKKSKKQEEEEEDVSTAESNEEEAGDDDTAEDHSETDSDSEEEEEKPKSKKTFKKKPQVYQRTNETHKEIFSGVLKAVAPDWKKTPESKEKAKSVSKKMEGTEFLDENGEVLPEFKAALKKSMGKK